MQSPKALQHFKVDPVLKINVTFYKHLCGYLRCRVFHANSGLLTPVSLQPVPRRRPLIFQTMNSDKSNSQSLKY